MNDRIKGIIEALVDADDYELVQNLFEIAIQTYAKHIVDNCVRQNANFHYESGLSPKIIRITSGKTCKWCQALRGVYKYEDVKDTGNDVFRRHANCDCLVVYDPMDGSKTVQNVHNKRKYDETNFLKLAKLQDNYGNFRFTSKEGEAIIITKKQFGKKYGRHAQDYNFNPGNNKDRNRFLEITYDIISDYDEVREGPWRDQSGICTYYIKGNDVVIVNNGVYVTTMKGGINNARIKNARKR